MACFSPLHCYTARKGGITFNRNESIGSPRELPCRRCIGCRLDQSQGWAVRCTHEIQWQEQQGRPSCFITLTYNDEHLPPDHSLNKKHLSDFIKSLRQKLSPQLIRFYGCGEYGEKFARPHYHAIIFGYDFSEDRKLWKISNGMRLYTSEQLSSTWHKGFCSIGTATFQSAAYIARYIMKKQNGEAAPGHYLYQKIGAEELIPIAPEFTIMSNRPGIAADWFAQFHGDVYPANSVRLNNRWYKPPLYYRNIYKKKFPKEYSEVLEKAKIQHQLHKDDNTPERLWVREQVKQAKIRRLKREYEHDSENIHGL